MLGSKRMTPPPPGARHDYLRAEAVALWHAGNFTAQPECMHAPLPGVGTVGPHGGGGGGGLWSQVMTSPLTLPHRGVITVAC